MTTEQTKIKDFCVYVRALAFIFNIHLSNQIEADEFTMVMLKYFQEIFTVFFKSDMKKYTHTIHNTLFEECFN